MSTYESESPTVQRKTNITRQVSTVASYRRGVTPSSAGSTCSRTVTRQSRSRLPSTQSSECEQDQEEDTASDAASVRQYTVDDGHVDDEYSLSLSSSEESDGDGEEDAELSTILYNKACHMCGVRVTSAVTRGLSASEIHLRHRAMTDKDVKALCLALLNNAKVTHVDLRGNDLSPTGAAYISEMLGENIFISHLDLSDNSIGTRGLQSLCNSLESNNVLYSLGLSGTGLTEEGAPHVAKLLKTNSSLCELDLSHNQLEVNGTHILASAIEVNTRLEVLDLSWNHIRLKGAESMCIALGRNKNLKKVMLGFNGLSQHGCMHLERTLQTTKCIKYLDLTNNRIEKMGIDYLLNGMAKNTSLVILKLGDNMLDTKDAVSVLKTVKENKRMPLEHLDLTHIAVDTNFVNLLKEVQLEREELNVTHDVIFHRGEIRADLYVNKDPLLELLQYCKKANLRLLDLFHLWDVDNNLSIDKEEFAKGLKEAGIDIPLRSLNNLMDRLDLDGDGEVDFGELLQAQRKLRGKVALKPTVASSRRGSKSTGSRPGSSSAEAREKEL